MKKLDILHIHKHKRKNLCYNTIDRKGKAEIVPLPGTGENDLLLQKGRNHYGKAG